MRTFDVLVWGATGVTGKRVCQQLADVYQNKVKWAMAGRSQRKLSLLRNELSKKHETCRDVPVIVADIEDRVSIDAMVQQADVIIACAGPFPKYSDVVVEACVKERTDILDVTGEVHWVRSIIDRFEEEAKRNSVRVVNCCGFDSVPSDIGAYFLVNHVNKTLNRKVQRILGCIETKNVSAMPASGGTLASVIDILKQGVTQEIAADQYYLNPSNVRPTVDGVPDTQVPRYDDDFKIWTSPFLMQSVNKRVVQRSAALASEKYGPAFTYAECVKESGFLSALSSTIGLVLGLFTLSFPPLRSLLFAIGLFPKPGQGPSVEDEERCSWRMTMYGLVEPSGSEEETDPTIVKTRISDNFGGYTSTARMVLECAMCLIADKEKLKDENLSEGGVLTPATAFGDVLVQRLNSIGIKSEVL